VHAPLPSHALGVSMKPLHVLPHGVVAAVYWHAPVPLAQPLAPQMPPVVHAEGPSQQFPVPVVPQMPLAHAVVLGLQAVPFERRHAVPPTHVSPVWHPAFVPVVHVVAHAEPSVLHANPFAQSAATGLLHVPPPHWLCAVSMFVETLHDSIGHDRHTSPFDPHSLFAPPPWHVPASGDEQQPPLQSTLDEQTVSHVFVVVSQLTSDAQSPLPVHPHAPPMPASLGTHAVPALRPTQLPHPPPLVPHAVCD
jgi:hypothetical protein